MKLATPTRTMLVTTLLSLLCLGLGCASGSAASRAPSQDWNQQKVTALAGQLTTSARALYTVLYQDPQSQSLSMENGQDSMGGSIRKLGESAAGLHAKLESGQDRTATLHEYQRIKELSRDAAESARFTDLAMDATQANALMNGLLSQLDGYYGAY
jgi:hypothetical protein